MKYIKNIIKFTLIFYFNPSFAPYFLDFEKTKLQGEQTINFNDKKQKFFSNEFIRMIVVDFDPSKPENGAQFLFASYFNINKKKQGNNYEKIDINITKKSKDFTYQCPKLRQPQNSSSEQKTLTFKDFSLTYKNGVITFSTNSNNNFFWRIGNAPFNNNYNSQKSTSEIQQILTTLSEQNYLLTKSGEKSKTRCNSPDVVASNFLFFIKNQLLVNLLDKDSLSDQKGEVGETIADIIMFASNNTITIHDSKIDGNHGLDKVYEFTNKEVLIIEAKFTDRSQNVHSQTTENFTKINKKENGKDGKFIIKDKKPEIFELITTTYLRNQLSAGAIFVLNNSFIDCGMKFTKDEDSVGSLGGFNRRELLNESQKKFKEEVEKTEKETIINTINKAFELTTSPAVNSSSTKTIISQSLLYITTKLKETFNIQKKELEDIANEIISKKSQIFTQADYEKLTKEKKEALDKIKEIIKKFSFGEKELNYLLKKA